jgi:hypothetical protein
MTANLLDAVLADPDAEAPRREFARACDALGDPRGHFIRLQLDAAAAERSGAPSARFLPWVFEADALVVSHGASWSADLRPPCREVFFVRGFAEHVALSAGDFIVGATELLSRAPIRHLNLSGSAADLQALFALPAMASIRSLSLDRFGLRDQDLHWLADSLHLGNLEWLDLMRNDIGLDGARALAAASGLPKLRYVGFFGNRVDPSEEFFFDQGIVVDKGLPPAGEQLEREFGPIPWLHVDAETAHDLPPPRY